MSKQNTEKASPPRGYSLSKGLGRDGMRKGLWNKESLSMAGVWSISRKGFGLSREKLACLYPFFHFFRPSFLSSLLPSYFAFFSL